MDPKFIEKGLTPVDLMTVKKKLEVCCYDFCSVKFIDCRIFNMNFTINSQKLQLLEMNSRLVIKECSGKIFAATIENSYIIKYIFIMVEAQIRSVIRMQLRIKVNDILCSNYSST